MSIFKFLFDSDYQQRADIEELREQAFQTAMHAPDASRQIKALEEEVRELAATVHVLMRTMSAAGQLDVAKLQQDVAAELAPKPKRKKAKARAEPQEPQAPPTEQICVRCKTKGWSNEMTRVGTDIWCRTCARNP